MNRQCQEFAQDYRTEPGKKLILDVRNPDEVAGGQLSGALNIPLADLEKRVGEISKETRVFVHCKSGGRAQKAAEVLERSGFRNVVCAVDGGYDLLKGQLP